LFVLSAYFQTNASSANGIKLGEMATPKRLRRQLVVFENIQYFIVVLHTSLASLQQKNRHTSLSVKQIKT